MRTTRRSTMAWACPVRGRILRGARATAPQARKSARVILAWGFPAAPFLRIFCKKYPVGNVRVEVRAIRNAFFGESVTVAGLVTGGDLIAQLSGARADAVLITRTMLRAGEEVFTPDDTTLEQVVCALGML